MCRLCNIYGLNAFMYNQKLELGDKIDTENWFTLGAEVGLKVVDDQNVSDRDDTDKEVTQVFKNNKDIHQKMLQGTVLSPMS